MKYYFLAILAIFPSIALAQNPTFNTIPFLNGIVNTANVADALFSIAIAIAAILVVVRLVWAGSRYMLSGLVTGKESAKEDIRNAILGLLIILGSVTILQTINPQLLNLNALGSLQSQELENATTSGGEGGDEITGDYVVGDFAIGDSKTSLEINHFCTSQVSRDELCASRVLTALENKCAESGGSLVPRWAGRAYSYDCK